MSTYQERSSLLFQSILEMDYFIALLESIVGPLSEFDAKISKMKDSELKFTWSRFWFRLPDARHIRTGPFFALCDLCDEATD